jgi:hypothetical protein
VNQIVAAAPLDMLRGLRLEVLADDRLPGRGPGRAPNGNFVVSQLRVYAISPDRPGEPRRLKLRQAEADYSQGGYDVSGAIDGQSETGWAVDGRTGANHTAAFIFSRPVACEPGTRLIFEIDHQHDAQHVLGRFRLSLTGDDAPLLRPEHPDEWRELLAAAPGTLEDSDEAQLRGYYYSLDNEYRELERAQQLVANPRLAAVQDLAWALINSPAFLFNH